MYQAPQATARMAFHGVLDSVRLSVPRASVDSIVKVVV